MRLEEREAASAKAEENDGVQQSDVSSTTPSATDADGPTDTCQSDSPDTIAEDTPASACNSDEVCSSSQDAGSIATSVEVTAENHISPNDLNAVLSV